MLLPPNKLFVFCLTATISINKIIRVEDLIDIFGILSILPSRLDKKAK